METEEHEIARKVVYAPAIGELELDTMSLLKVVMEDQGKDLDGKAKERVANWFYEKYKNSRTDEIEGGNQ